MIISSTRRLTDLVVRDHDVNLNSTFVKYVYILNYVVGTLKSSHNYLHNTPYTHLSIEMNCCLLVSMAKTRERLNDAANFRF